MSQPYQAPTIDQQHQLEGIVFDALNTYLGGLVYGVIMAVEISSVMVTDPLNLKEPQPMPAIAVVLLPEEDPITKEPQEPRRIILSVPKDARDQFALMQKMQYVVHEMILEASRQGTDMSSFFHMKEVISKLRRNNRKRIITPGDA
jgi:hypothetical protein